MLFVIESSLAASIRIPDFFTENASSESVYMISCGEDLINEFQNILFKITHKRYYKLYQAKKTISTNTIAIRTRIPPYMQYFLFKFLLFYID